MLKTNNILSYFTKDIKDTKECALYKQMNTTNNIEILYKGKLLYKLQHYKLQPEICWNYKTNIIKKYFTRSIINYIINYKINSNKKLKIKALFYKKDNKIAETNGNYISYSCIYNKYLIKNSFYYVAEFTSLLCIKSKYYNGYIYKYIYRYKGNLKYKHVRILIMNKYELHYINRFFNIYN